MSRESLASRALCVGAASEMDRQRLDLITAFDAPDAATLGGPETLTEGDGESVTTSVHIHYH